MVATPRAAELPWILFLETEALGPVELRWDRVEPKQSWTAWSPSQQEAERSAEQSASALEPGSSVWEPEDAVQTRRRKRPGALLHLLKKDHQKLTSRVEVMFHSTR